MLIIDISKHSFCSGDDADNKIMSQICTCHDSWAVMTRAKLWPDEIIIFVLEQPICLHDLKYISS